MKSTGKEHVPRLAYNQINRLDKKEIFKYFIESFEREKVSSSLFV